MGRRKSNRWVQMKKFKGIEVKLNLDEIIDKNAKYMVEVLKRPNYSPRSKRPRRDKAYWKGWGYDSDYKGEEIGAVIWNKTNWQLTWLLENGHIINNQIGAAHGLGWSPPKKHIYPSYLAMKSSYQHDIKTKLKGEVKLK